MRAEELSHDRSGWQVTAREVAKSVVSRHAEDVDARARWPAESMRALGDAGLLGLNAPVECGGGGQGLQALAVVTEEIGRACGSSALVYGMHCVATKVIEAKATDRHRERYLEPIAAGEHVTSLALAEPGTGVHFYLPRTTFRREDDEFRLNGSKTFVTSGGHADSYVLSVVAEGSDMDPGTFSCLLMDAGSPGAEWGPAWDGFGMRGNSSRSLTLEEVPVPAGNMLGELGDETWYVFEVIAPYFIVAMAGTYVGIALGALDRTVQHLRSRTYDHTGKQAGAADAVAHRVGELWTTLERARQLLRYAARLGDGNHPDARLALFASKADVADAAVWVANEAMTLAGGIAYGHDSALGRALRDARASHVMSPSTDLLKTWLGRSLLDLPLLS